jgi:hypothetical protein
MRSFIIAIAATRFLGAGLTGKAAAQSATPVMLSSSGTIILATIAPNRPGSI